MLPTIRMVGTNYGNTAMAVAVQHGLLTEKVSFQGVSEVHWKSQQDSGKEKWIWHQNYGRSTCSIISIISHRYINIPIYRYINIPIYRNLYGIKIVQRGTERIPLHLFNCGSNLSDCNHTNYIIMSSSKPCYKYPSISQLTRFQGHVISQFCVFRFWPIAIF